jgi:hypothetical protein
MVGTVLTAPGCVIDDATAVFPRKQKKNKPSRTKQRPEPEVTFSGSRRFTLRLLAVEADIVEPRGTGHEGPTSDASARSQRRGALLQRKFADGGSEHGARHH